MPTAVKHPRPRPCLPTLHCVLKAGPDCFCTSAPSAMQKGVEHWPFQRLPAMPLSAPVAPQTAQPLLQPFSWLLAALVANSPAKWSALSKRAHEGADFLLRFILSWRYANSGRTPAFQSHHRLPHQHRKPHRLPFSFVPGFPLHLLLLHRQTVGTELRA